MLVEIVAMWVVTPCNIVGGYHLSENRAASIFRVGMNGVRMHSVITAGYKFQ
jgi:hypothetical protein